MRMEFNKAYEIYSRIKNNILTVFKGDPFNIDLLLGGYFTNGHILLEDYNDAETINVGTGLDCTILELAETIKKVVGFQGELEFDVSKPDGTPRKLMDVSYLHSLGWKHKIELEDGIKLTYDWFKDNYEAHFWMECTKE